jgi:hypothetical protein
VFAVALDVADAAVFEMDFDPAAVHFKEARAGQFFKDLAGRLRATHGVQAVALEYQDVAVIRPESPVAREDVKTSGVWIDDGFFDTLDIPIVEGRAIRRADLRASPDVAMVNDVLARRYWPGQDAVGKHIHLSTGQWVVVIGVVRLNAFMSFGSPPMDTIFLPYGEPTQRDIRLLARSVGDPQALVDPIRKVVRDLDQRRTKEPSARDALTHHYEVAAFWFRLTPAGDRAAEGAADQQRSFLIRPDARGQNEGRRERRQADSLSLAGDWPLTRMLLP